MADILVVRNVPHEGSGRFGEVFLGEGLSVEEVDSEISEWDPTDHRAIAVFGGSASANDQTESMTRERERVALALERQIPMLNVCLGDQVLAVAAGGEVSDSQKPEVGFFDDKKRSYVVRLTEAGLTDPLLAGVPVEMDVFQLHQQEVSKLPANATVLAMGKTTTNQMMRVGKNAYGIQFHPEVTPGMLDIWIENDPGLRELSEDDKQELRENLRKMRRNFGDVGSLIASNFVRIVRSS